MDTFDLKSPQTQLQLKVPAPKGKPEWVLRQTVASWRKATTATTH